MSGRLTRRGLLAAAAGGAAAVGMPGVASGAPTRRVRGNVGGLAFEFVATLTQDGAAFSGFGYLTGIAGLPASALFSSADDQSEATARFTFSLDATGTGRWFHETLKVIAAEGDLAIFHRTTTGADFSDPSSFARGRRVARYSGRYQSVVTATSATAGNQELRGELLQESAAQFRSGGRNVRLGAKGVRHRIAATGWSELLSAEGPRAESYVAGVAELASR